MKRSKDFSLAYGCRLVSFCLLFVTTNSDHRLWSQDPLELFAVDNANYSDNQFCKCDEACLDIGDCCPNCPNAMSALRNSHLGRNTIRCLAVPDINRPVMVSYGCRVDHRDLKVVQRCQDTGFVNSSSLYANQDGLLFSNWNCVLCNHEIVPVVRLSIDSPSRYQNRIRYCQPSVDFCTISGITIWNRSLSDLCYRFSAPVVSTKDRYVIYKNVFCAMCNGAPLARLRPFSHRDAFRFNSNYMMTVDQGHSGKDNQRQLKIGVTEDEIPAAFSILLNFGLDGKENMMFSSSNAEKLRRQQEKCGRNLLWDPFSKICRQLYCSVEYVLVDFQCVRNNNGGSVGNETEAHKLPVYQYQPETVALRLSMQTDAVDLAHYFEEFQNSTTEFANDISESLADFYKINPERIKNLNLTTEVLNFDNPWEDSAWTNLTYDNSSFFKDLVDLINNLERSLEIKVNFSVRFDLFETPRQQESEPEIRKVVNQMVSSISTGSFNICVEKLPLKIFAIHENAAVNEWCLPYLGERRVVYWNDEFEMILFQNTSSNENWVKEVYINKTGTTYDKGDFVANILFQGIERDDGKVNISGYVIVCERHMLSPSCSRVLLNPEEFQIMPNATLLYYGNNSNVLDLSVFEPADNESVLVCFDSVSIIKSMNFRFQFNAKQALISLPLLCISVVSLGLVLFTYVVFPELRNLPGCNTINLTQTLFLSQGCFLLSQRKSVKGVMCEVTGAILHYLILASFFWMNVMAYDLYKTFGNKNVLTFIRPKRKFLPRYMAYAYLTPGLIIGMSVYLDKSDLSLWLKPMYGAMGSCWIGNPRAALVLFASPLAVILVVNLTFYILTICSISNVHNKIETKTKPANGKRDVQLYMRIATCMGFCWVFGFLSAFLSNRAPEVSEVLTYLFIVFNTLQGLFIFFAFVCNRRVFALYGKAYNTLNNTTVTKCASCGQTFCVCKAKVAMKRSASSETYVSIISGQDN